MQNSLLAINWLVLLPLGVALHWSLHLIYGGRRGRSAGALHLMLSTAAWLFLMAGVLGPITVYGGPFGVLLTVAFFGVTMMFVQKYRHAEGRTLLWFLAVAAERQWSLAEAARTFAADRTDEMGRRADRLADLLDTGVPLPDALQQSKNHLPLDAQLAARLGHESGDIAVALKESARDGGRFAPIWEPFLQRLIYLILVVAMGLVLVNLGMIRVMPTYTVILADFEVDMPRVAAVFVAMSSFLYQCYPVIAVLELMILLVLFWGILMILGKFIWEPPPLAWFTRRYHGAHVLRSLAQAVEFQRPMDETFDRLGASYPRGHVRRRLDEATVEIRAGTHWCDALEGSRLIAPADAAVLRAAERVGNLPWALREMSNSAMRRLATRLHLGLNLGIPAAIVAVGAFVGLFAWAVLEPLMKLVMSLT